MTPLICTLTSAEVSQPACSCQLRNGNEEVYDSNEFSKLSLTSAGVSEAAHSGDSETETDSGREDASPPKLGAREPFEPGPPP